MIIAPAIKTPEGKIYASRNSHSELIILYPEEFKHSEQGFITDDLRFVDRITALKEAIKYNDNLEKLVDTDELYSEDLFLKDYVPRLNRVLKELLDRYIPKKEDILAEEFKYIPNTEDNSSLVNALIKYIEEEEDLGIR